MNEYAKQKQTHRYRKQTCGYQRGERGKWGGTNQENGINRDKQDYIVQYRNYSHYLVITSMEKNL